MVCTLYNEELLKGEISRLQLLELSGYLENYLWKHLSEDSSFQHVFSILMMVNEKFREGVPVFEALTADAAKFQLFFKSVVQMSNLFQVPLCAQEDEQLVRQYTIYIHFLVNTFRSLEDPVVRNSTLKYLSLPMWGCLSEARLQEELNKVPQIKRHWEHLQSQASAATAVTVEAASSSSKKIDASPPSKSQAKKKKVSSKKSAEEISPVATSEPTPVVSPKPVDNSDKTWIFGLMTVYVRTVEEISAKAPETLSTKSMGAVLRYLERFSEFILDLLSQLPTRRFLNAVLDDMHLLIKCKRASVFTHPDGKLLSQLIGMIDACMHFEVHDQTGRALSPQDMMTVQNSRIHRLQTLAFSNYKIILKDLVFSSSGELAKPETLKKHFQLLTTKQLTDVASKLGKMSENDLEVYANTAEQSNLLEESNVKSSVSLLSPVEFLEDSDQRSFVMDVLIDSLSARMSQLEAMNRLSLYPSEELLWDQYQVPLENRYYSDRPLALPKLNLQFLTVHDYLLRNFELFRLESAFQIRGDLIDSITRMGPRCGLKGNTLFGGWARMALPIVSVSIDEISKPQLGETIPGHVHCTIEVDISRFSGVIREEWEALRGNDIIFLVGIEDPQPDAAADLDDFKDERADMSVGRVPRMNMNAEKLLEDKNYPKKFGTYSREVVSISSVLLSVMIFQQLSLSYHTCVSGDHHVTT